MLTRRQIVGGAAACAALRAGDALAQGYDPILAPDLLLPERDLSWWRDAKFGVFVHWGLYAIPGRGEWHMFSDQVPVAQYAALASQFAPRHYDPQVWANVARRAGAKYMVMTARHHDGFALFHSPSSYGGFDAPRSAAGRDLIAPYVDAVRGAGLGAGIYYSLMDWRFPGYFHPREMADNALLMKQQCYAQMRELTANYGNLDIIWYDGGWLAHQGSDADAAWFWEPDKLNRLVREQQPDVLINPRSGWQGDFDVEEGARAIGGPIRARPWEKTFSLNQAWGYLPTQNLISADEVIGFIVNAAVRNGNVLANVGPDREGLIPPEQITVLQRVGFWMERYGESLYETRPGPFEPIDGVVGATCKGDFIYLHILSWPNATLRLPPLRRQIVSARNLTGAVVHARQERDATLVAVPIQARDPVDTIVRLELSPDRKRALRSP